MAKLTHVLGLMVAPFLMAACTQTAGGPPPGMTAAQGAAYCAKLTTVYGEYVAGLPTSMGGVGRGGGQSDIDARVAIAQCQDGNTAAGIPVLQRELRDNKVPVPSP
ncbi:hypothetical protein [Reyranella sp.]|jgi:hypothetical protein|uniref:hypothetical protein n=1 Tax=Reyranella sp. TaxID=1929291 RepID=UPI000BD6A904|nr:hypothetical protein [Reyranella sp.]OYY40684.1 MAG: hypothetical protein B7Y57_16685 [Rhodospirillales bacterium 35-66-84]OYZ93244.1 MAG: hypothetical protein B7Y08_17930 [Rhodospirillales bacterium 24-66-33]OZB24519.1 MAG: hypothetical protein B7X63_15150 [Rhodospirillales bacterium 39-66-50]HQS18035.1 hypothetical protein [Reyranella sp.]HQT14610.1 hypothetical protein [Reyranella sp.]